MTQTFRALLVGVPVYRDEGIADLPFIESDLAELADALRAASFDVMVQKISETNKDNIDDAIEFFIQDADPQDTLLIFLSGHGIHYNGMDYLVPEGARVRSYEFTSKCVPIDFDKYIEHSRVGNIVIAIDACREGIRFLEKGVVNIASWSDRTIRQVAGRCVAYVYACSPGERAHYASDGNTTFSLFSRAFSQVVRDGSGPADLTGIAVAIQSELDKLTADHSFPLQQVRVLSEANLDDFVILNRPLRSRSTVVSDHPWVVEASEHMVWDHVANGPAIDELRTMTCELVKGLSRLWESDRESLQEDPWLDAQFAERMNARIRWLLSTVLNKDKLSLSPAEASLLVSFPFLYHAYWAHQAAKTAHINPAEFFHQEGPEERSRFEQFAAGYGRLVRRAKATTKSGNAAPAAAIGWWLFHRWLSVQAGCYDAAQLDDLIGSTGLAPKIMSSRLTAETFSSERLMKIMQSLRADAAVGWSDSIGKLDLHQLAASATDVEQPIRGQLLAYLLAAAYQFAVEAKALPEIIVDHLGISYAVGVPQIDDTVRSSSWEARGRTRVLTALCTHPAVELALRDQVNDVDLLLEEIEKAAAETPYLMPLADMPTHATADKVRAVTLDDGKRAYDSTELRFRLAEDRIQELLMGEQLYGDPALAIRELYQNALDACRYRDARMAYLRKIGKSVPAWRGRITFRQGEDESGLPFVECSDNGIGMGLRELHAVFSHSGMRFADLPECIEEMADWKAAGIELYPNSRFGIGVLSYFMLADDITVTTCRLDRSGKPGEVLKVHIAGPGALFEVRNEGLGEDAGTTVRLLLRSSDDQLSCTDLLQRILWISDYNVEASDQEGRISWEGGQLSRSAPIGVANPIATATGHDLHIIDPSGTAALWWCAGWGALLADGLWAGANLFGAVIDLSGPHIPMVTVDRKQILSFDRSAVTNLLRGEIPSLCGTDGHVLDCLWLSRLCEYDPRLADEISEYAIRTQHAPWVVAGVETDISAVGSFAPDDQLFTTEKPLAPRPGVFDEDMSLEVEPEGVPSSGLKPVHDARVLTDDASESPMKRSDGVRRRVPGRRISLGRRSTVGIDGLVKWRFLVWVKAGLLGSGLRTSDALASLVARPSDEIVGSVLSSVLGRDGRDRAVVNKIRLIRDMAEASIRTGRSLPEVASWLAVFGATVPDVAGMPEQISDNDLEMLSEGRGERRPMRWRDPAEAVPLHHMADVAVRTERSLQEVAARLMEFGFVVPDVTGLPERIERDDLLLFFHPDYDDDDENEVADPAGPLPLHHLIDVASRTGRRLPEVAGRMAEFGFIVPDVTGLPDRIDRNDLQLLSGTVDRQGRWLDPADAVTPVQLAVQAGVTGRSLAEVAARLAEFGFTVPDVTGLPDRISRDDLLLFSQDADRRDPWLDPADAVSPAQLAVRAGIAERSLAEVAARLAEFGFTVPDVTGLPDRISRDDLLLFSRDADREGPWLDPAEAIGPAQLAMRAARAGRSVSRAAARLAEFGFTVPDVTGLPERIDGDDLMLFFLSDSDDLDDFDDAGRGGLGLVGPVPLHHLAEAASRTRRRLSEVAARLAEFGFTVPDITGLPERIDRDDLLLLSRNVDRKGPWLEPAEAIGPAQLAVRAGITGRSLPEVAARLAEFGFVVPDVTGLPERIDGDDLLLLSRDVDRESPWLDPAEAIGPAQLAVRAARADQSLPVAATRLAEFGFLVPDVASLPDRIDRDDQMLLAGLLRGIEGPDPSQPLSYAWLASVVRAGGDVAEIAVRLTRLGFDLPDALRVRT